MFLNFKKIEGPMVVLRNIIRDFPWLWAVCQTWGLDTIVRVVQVHGSTFLAEGISGERRDAGQFFVYFCAANGECVRPILDTGIRTLFDVLAVLHAERINLAHVKNIARKIDDGVIIYRARTGTFADLFNAHPLNN